MPSSIRSSRALAGLGLLSAVVSLSGCYVNPPGWGQRQADAYVVRATPWKPFGRSPWSWELPDKRRIEIEPDEGGLRAAFTDASAHGLRCDDDVHPPGLSHARLLCYSDWDHGVTLRFWLAPDQDCPWTMFEQIGTSAREACWTGAATLNGKTLELVRGHQKGTNYPIDRATWLDENQQLVMAADFVSSMKIQFYPNAAAPQPPDDGMTLLTASIVYWERTLPFRH